MSRYNSLCPTSKAILESLSRLCKAIVEGCLNAATSVTDYIRSTPLEEMGDEINSAMCRDHVPERLSQRSMR